MLQIISSGRLQDKRKDGQNLIAVILNIETAADMNKRTLTQLFLMNLQDFLDSTFLLHSYPRPQRVHLLQNKSVEPTFIYPCRGCGRTVPR